MSKLLWITFLTAGSLLAPSMSADYAGVLKTLVKQGDFKDGASNIPRNDLKVTIDGIATPTVFGFGG